jgi:general secretion pathway protein I
LSIAPQTTDRADAGFTIIEVLIALAVVAVGIVAIGSVMSTNARGVRSMEQHVLLKQVAQAVLATGIPPRSELVPGTVTGQTGDYRWQVDIGPLTGELAQGSDDAAWVPELVSVHVWSPGGAVLELHTVRLMHGSRK